MKEISRIELFCDDASVGHIQRILTQVKGVYDVKAIPVVNAKRFNGKIKAISHGNLAQRFLSHLIENKIIEFKPTDVHAWLKAQGRSKLSASYVAGSLIELGVVIKHGNSSATRYTVRAPKALPPPKKVRSHA
jgi:hypothetical protein